MTSMDHNYCFWENWEKFCKNFSDFWGGDGLSNRFFERLPTFPNFLRLDSDRPSLVDQFELSHGHSVELAQKLLRNYEKITTKS